MHVTQVYTDLTVSDLERAHAFYADYLGLAEEELNLGWVVRWTDPQSRSCVQLVTTDASAPVNPVVSIKVDDVQAAYDQARERGYEIVHPLTTEPWGVSRFFVCDPDGNVLNILQGHGPD